MVTMLSLGIFGQDAAYFSDPWTGAPGFKPEMPYRSLSDAESVNVFNGNLSVILPIGPSLPAGPDLSFQAQLRYVGPYSGAEDDYTNFYSVVCPGNTWRIDKDLIFRDNAGKWVLFYGKIHTRYNGPNGNGVSKFIDSNGTVHELHPVNSDNQCDFDSNNIFVTSDGSGIRAYFFGHGESLPIHWVVYLPSGIIMEFAEGRYHYADDQNTVSGADYFVTKVQDRFGNGYGINYDSATRNCENCWPKNNVSEIYDLNPANPNRRIQFTYEKQPLCVPIYARGFCSLDSYSIAVQKVVLSSITLPGASGQTVYNLNYGTVGGGLPPNYSDVCQGYDTTSYLEEIVFPTTESGQLKMQFDYYFIENNNLEHLDCPPAWGALKTITYPGGGKSTYSYSSYEYYLEPGENLPKCDPRTGSNLPCMSKDHILAGVGVSQHITDDGCGNRSVTKWFRPQEGFSEDRVNTPIVEVLPDGQMIGHLCYRGKDGTSEGTGTELKVLYFDNPGQSQTISMEDVFHFIIDGTGDGAPPLKKLVENRWESGGNDESMCYPYVNPANFRIKCSKTTLYENNVPAGESFVLNDYWDGYGHYKVTYSFGQGMQKPIVNLRKYDLSQVTLQNLTLNNYLSYPYYRDRLIAEVTAELTTDIPASCFSVGLLPGDPIENPGDDNAEGTTFSLLQYISPNGYIESLNPSGHGVAMAYFKNKVIRRIETGKRAATAHFFKKTNDSKGGIYLGDLRLNDDYTGNLGDKIITYIYDGVGQLTNVNMEKSYLNGSPASTATISYGWSQGLPSSKKYGNSSYYESQREIHEPTGLITSEKDANNLVTGYSYDDLGRLTAIIPPSSEKPVFISYPTANDIINYRGPDSTVPSFDGTDPTGSLLDPNAEYSRYHYDGLGRLTRTIKLRADASTTPWLTYEDTVYDAMGNTIFASLPYVAGSQMGQIPINYPSLEESSPADGNCGSQVEMSTSIHMESVPVVRKEQAVCPYGTVQSIYKDATCGSMTTSIKDPLGRIRSIISPDGKVTAVDYYGFSTTTTIKEIQGTGTSLLTSSKTSYYDAIGRLIGVNEPIGTDAVYRYDMAGRLLDAELFELTGTPDNFYSNYSNNGYRNLGVQKRSFIYDNNGNLYENYQPENGLTKVLSYDVWGNPLQIEDSNGRAGAYVIENSYDLKGRKLSTSKKTSTETTLLSQWEYDQPSGGTFYLNRLTMEKSLYPAYTSGGITYVRESYKYDDASGRISEKTTSSAGNIVTSVKSFNVSYGYDQYGRVVSEGLSTPFGQNMILNNYMHGYLDQRIFMDSGKGAQKILYHPSGAIKEIWLDETKKIERTEEASTGRLQEIIYGGWRTGIYKYDGAGNIYQIGNNDKYYYDELSRLKQANVGHVPSGTGPIKFLYTLGYEYDNYGNMTKRTITQTMGGSQNMSADYAYAATISTVNNKIQSITTGSGSYLTGSVNYDLNGNQTLFNGWTYSYDELNRLKMGIKGAFIPRYYYNPEGERLVHILKTSDADGESTYYFKDGLHTIGELQYKMTDSQVNSIKEKFYLYVGNDILATSEKQYSMSSTTLPMPPEPVDPKTNSVGRICIKNYASGIMQQAIVSLSDVVAYESNGQKFDASYTLGHISDDIAGVMVRIARIKDQGNSNDNGNGCPRNDEDKIEYRCFLREGLDTDFVFGGFGLCGNEDYGTISSLETGHLYPVVFTGLQKDKPYRVTLYAWTSWAADPNLGFNIMKVEEGQLLVPKKSPSTFFEMRGVTTDEGQGFTGKLRAKWGQLSGTTGYNVKAIKNNGESVILNGSIPITGNSYQIDEDTALSMGVAADASYQLEAIIIYPTQPIIIGPIRDDLLPIKCTGGTPTGYSIPTLTKVKVFTGQIAYISWDKGEYPAPYYKVFQRVSEPGQTLGQFVEIGVTDKDFFVYTGAPQINEDQLLAYSIQPFDEALNPVTSSSFAKLAEFINVTNTAPRPRNMSMGDGNRLVEVNWWGYAVEGTQGPFGTSEPITFDSESGLYYELLRGYNPSVTAMGCDNFSLADFTIKQTTFEPYHEDTQFGASDENPLVAYKVRINYQGNLTLPESECKWTHVGFCYDRPHVEWIHGYFTGNFNDDGAPIVTLEWAAAGPDSTTVYDLWRNGKYELYDISGTSITFAIGGHPDSTDVTHEFGVRAVNLPDGCLSDLVTCTVTVPGDVTECPPEPGDILLMSSIVGPEYDANGELAGIKVQLVWSGETGSFIKIHRSFEECDRESPVIDTVSSTQSCYYDILQSGQIAYYYVQSGRNNCEEVGESECLTVSVLPQTGLNGGTVYFYVKDHLGNSRLVLDSDGNIQSRMDYEPYGVELYPLAANTSGEKYKFTNQERDYSTGLDYFHARYYSSAMGRFMGADKVGGEVDIPQSWNKYWYANDRPLVAVDPNGMDTYLINRTLGGDKAKKRKLGESRYFRWTHTFIVTTDEKGNIEHTYSWRTPDKSAIGKWEKDFGDDVTAAKEALAKGMYERVGDDTLDSYIDKAYDKHNNENDPSVHLWIFWDQCKVEADKLVSEAKQMQQKDKTAGESDQQEGKTSKTDSGATISLEAILSALGGIF